MRKTLWIKLGSDLLKKYMIFFRFYLTKADALDVPLSFLVYENLNKIPITERVLNSLNIKSGKQQEYLLHMLEEMSFGLDRLL